MPQGGLEALFSGARACAAPHPSLEDPDLPPESIQIPIAERANWVDPNSIYDRDDSTKGTTNPKSQNAGDRRRSNSLRYSGNPNPAGPIIGLPSKLQRSGYYSRSVRRQTDTRIFPKKGGKTGLPGKEPASPKVSCIGKVRSNRERDRRLGLRPGCRRGFWKVIFCCAGGEGATVECVEESPAPSGKIPAAEVAAREAPALGTMRRFSSKRRPASWGGDDDGHGAISGPLDEDGFQIRRSVGSLDDTGSCDVL